MKYHALFAVSALLWAQSSPSWGRAQIDSAASVIPRYGVSTVAQPNTRLPYFAVLHITGLEPNTWYRYVPRMDNSTAAPATNNVNLGAGNPLFYNAQGDIFWRTNTPSLQTAGGYDTVLTDASGKATLIFGIEPTSNTRFRTDGGNKVYVKVFFRSNDPSAPVDSAYVIGDKTPIQPLALRNCTADTCGSFLYDSSLAAPRTLVFLYDKYGPHTPGERPLSSAVVEPAGITWPTSMLATYTSQVSTQQKRYGTLIPNLLPNGVRAIHYVSPQSPGLLCDQAIFDQDGIWPSGINTQNPTNGPAAAGLVNSPYYPLPPAPSSNSCILPSINPVTGKIYTGYTWSPTVGFLYEMVLCPPSNYQPFSAHSTIRYKIYGLCEPALWGSRMDSLPGSSWVLSFLTNCNQPCVWYEPVPATFFWRCFAGGAGSLVQNFSYYSGYSYQTVMLAARRQPRKVLWSSLSLPSGPVNAGGSFSLTVWLHDTITATWGIPGGEPDFSFCRPGATLHLYDAQGNQVAMYSAQYSSSLRGIEFTGTWPATPGTYKLVVGDVPFPMCCSGLTGGWTHSDTIQVTVIGTTSLTVRTGADRWEVALPGTEGHLYLYDAQGRQVWQAEGTPAVSIPRQGLTPGLYTLVWRSERGVAVRKLLHTQP